MRFISECNSLCKHGGGCLAEKRVISLPTSAGTAIKEGRNNSSTVILNAIAKADEHRSSVAAAWKGFLDTARDIVLKMATFEKEHQSMQ